MMTDELLIKFLLDETTKAEKAEVQIWIAERDENLKQYQQFEKVWFRSKALSSESQVDVEGAWDKFQLKTRQAKEQAAEIPIKSDKTWLKVAAVFAIIMGSWLAYNLLAPTQYQDIVATKVVRKERLPDGSELTINKHSAISYAQDFNDNRSLKLENGSVFFEVAHDKKKPFVVAVDQVEVTVVGTSFHIRHEAEQTEVIVETGIVRVTLNGEELELRKGEKVLISKESSGLVKTTSSDQLYNYYYSKQFIAEGIPLEKLVLALNEAYATNITIKDPQLSAEPVYTILEESDGLDKNIQYLCKILLLKATKNQGQILLSRIE